MLRHRISASNTQPNLGLSGLPNLLCNQGSISFLPNLLLVTSESSTMGAYQHRLWSQSPRFESRLWHARARDLDSPRNAWLFFFFSVLHFYVDEKYVMSDVTANRTAQFILLVLLVVQTYFGNIRRIFSSVKLLGGANAPLP